eukprot:4412424-Pyramimonas_sp.AAC.1
MAPRSPPRFRRGPRESSESAPIGPKRPPRGTREVPKWPPSGLREPKVTFKMAQNGPSWLKMAHKMLQETLKPIQDGSR